MDETTASLSEAAFSTRGDAALALVIAWSAAEPWRTGEVALFGMEAREAFTLGRGDGDGPRVVFHRQRPGVLEARPGLEGAAISRKQLEVRLRAGGLSIERVGRCPMRVNGTDLDRALLAPGDVVHLVGQLVLFCTLRPRGPLAPCEYYRESSELGAPDSLGIVGESPAAWALRDRLAFAGTLDVHTLLLGESGTGKELAARAVHRLSARSAKKLVARNAATLPAGLVDAELFGNVKNYPNPGMPERPGLVGEANGGTLFLDEIGELPQELQAHLLRMLDRGGEYQRLGEAKTHHADIRFIGATNRSMESLKHDLLARFQLRIGVPALAARKEDLPLIAHHLASRMRRENPQLVSLARRADDKPLSTAEVDVLLRRDYPANVRDLETALLEAFAPKAIDRPLAVPAGAARAAVVSADEPSEALLRDVIAKHGTGRDATKALGLGSRYELLRLMKKYGIPGGA